MSSGAGGEGRGAAHSCIDSSGILLVGYLKQVLFKGLKEKSQGGEGKGDL